MTQEFVTMRREVVERALEAFNVATTPLARDRQEVLKAMEALRAALEQPQGEQQPVAWLKTWDSVGHAQTGMRRVDLTPECETWLANMFPSITPLYTRQQQPRQPLTDEQIDKIAEGMPGGLEGFLKGWGWRQFARAIEATNNTK